MDRMVHLRPLFFRVPASLFRHLCSHDLLKGYFGAAVAITRRQCPAR
jgi:hypothetical protein